MTYEEFLDEVTTLLTEMYELDDAAAIKRAKDDAKALFEQRKQKVLTQQKQQQRRAQQKKE